MRSNGPSRWSAPSPSSRAAAERLAEVARENTFVLTAEQLTLLERVSREFPARYAKAARHGELLNQHTLYWGALKGVRARSTRRSSWMCSARRRFRDAGHGRRYAVGSGVSKHETYIAERRVYSSYILRRIILVAYAPRGARRARTVPPRQNSCHCFL